MTTRIYSHADESTSALLPRQHPRSQTRIESVSLSVGHHPTISPRNHGLGFGCVPIRTGQHRIDYCWSCKTESQGKKEGWWWGNWRWWGKKLDFNKGEKSTWKNEAWFSSYLHTCALMQSILVFKNDLSQLRCKQFILLWRGFKK